MNLFRWLGFLVAAAVASMAQAEPVINVDEEVEYPAGLIERIISEAHKQRPEEIRRIRIGQFSPFEPYGVRVEYEPERFDTYAIARTLSFDISGEGFRKFYPVYQNEGPAFRMKDGPFGKTRFQTEIVRVFPLRTTTLWITLQDNLTYDEVLSLLQAMENGKVKIADKRISWWQTLFMSSGVLCPELKLPPVSDLQKIDCIYKDEDGINISINERRFHGTTYTFQKKGVIYFLVSIGAWVT